MAALQSNVWITLAELKLYLDIVNNSQDQLLIMLTNGAADFIEKYIGHSVKSNNYVNEEYDGTGSDVLVLKNFPVTAITSIQSRDTTITDTDSWDDVDAEDYFWYRDGRIIRHAGFSGWPLHYRVTYTAGYTTIPSDLSLALMDLVSYNLRSRKSRGIQSETLGEYSVTYSKKTLDEVGVLDTLSQYVNINL